MLNAAPFNLSTWINSQQNGGIKICGPVAGGNLLAYKSATFSLRRLLSYEISQNHSTLRNDDSVKKNAPVFLARGSRSRGSGSRGGGAGGVSNNKDDPYWWIGAIPLVSILGTLGCVLSLDKTKYGRWCAKHICGCCFKTKPSELDESTGEKYHASESLALDPAPV